MAGVFWQWNIRSKSYRGDSNHRGLSSWIWPHFIRRYVLVTEARREKLMYLSGAPESKTVVIENGVDTQAMRLSPEIRAAKRAELGLDDATTAILSVGRLIPLKNHATLVKAM